MTKSAQRGDGFYLQILVREGQNCNTIHYAYSFILTVNRKEAFSGLPKIKKPATMMRCRFAEGEGFEPPVRLHVRWFSRPVHSTRLCHPSGGYVDSYLLTVFSSRTLNGQPTTHNQSRMAACTHDGASGSTDLDRSARLFFSLPNAAKCYELTS